MAKLKKRKGNLFVRKGFYGFLSIVFTLVLAALIAALILPLPTLPDERPQMPEEFAAGIEAQLPEMVGGEGMPFRPEGSGMEQFPQFSKLPQAGTDETPPSAPAGMVIVSKFVSLIRGSWLPLVLLFGTLDLFSVLMFFLLRKKSRKEEPSPAEEEFDDEGIRRNNPSLPLLVIAFAASAAIFLSCLSEPEAADDDSPKPVTRLMSAQAQPGSISETLITGGTLSETRSELFSIAGDIEFTSFEVADGDFAEQGQTIATVDRVSVGMAIYELDELIRELDTAIEASRDDAVSNLILSPTRGRIKAVYAEKGDSVQDVMAEHGVLVRLSLDGMMAVDIETELDIGTAAAVRLSDGTILQAQVFYRAEGVSTVTMSDEKASYGDRVQVFSVNGEFLGEGELYIHSELKIVGFTGTVSEVYAAVDTQAEYEQTLIALSDTSYPGEYRQLLEKRRELEDHMNTLLRIYESGCVEAPCSGRVSFLNDDALEEATTVSFKSDVGIRAADSSESPSLFEQALLSIFDREEGVEKKVGEISGFDFEKLEVEIKLLDESTLTVPAAYMSSIPDIGDLVVLSYSEGELSGVEVYKSDAGNSENPGQGGIGGSNAAGQHSGMGSMTGGSMSGSGISDGNSASSAKEGAVPKETEEDIYAPEETMVCVITPYDSIQVEFSVSELDVGKIHVGQSVRVSLDAMPGKSFEAVISSIDPNGTNEGGSTSFMAYAVMDRSADMLSGMNAAIYIDIAGHEGLIIPVSALNESGKGSSVYTQYDSENDILGMEKTVETGYSDGNSVIILSGLELGEKVYYRYADSLQYSFIS